MASGEETNTSASSAEIQTSVQCVDNADGVDGVVVYGGETFAMTSEPHGLDSFIEWSCADGQGLYRKKNEGRKHL